MTSRSVVLTAADLAEQVAAVHAEFGQPALVEEFIDGREFHVTLWGNGTIEMLPPAEMDFSDFADVRERICSYDSKFNPDSDSYRRIRSLIPAPLEDDQMRALEAVCIAAYRAVGCRDYARLDLRLRDGVFQILDINPNADVSKDTSFSCAAKVAGYSYGALGSRIVRLAARRHPVFGGQ
jgi:D-alanine-D-alanine ligase